VVVSTFKRNLDSVRPQNITPLPLGSCTPPPPVFMIINSVGASWAEVCPDPNQLTSAADQPPIRRSIRVTIPVFMESLGLSHMPARADRYGRISINTETAKCHLKVSICSKDTASSSSTARAFQASRCLCGHLYFALRLASKVGPWDEFGRAGSQQRTTSISIQCAWIDVRNTCSFGTRCGA